MRLVSTINTGPMPWFWGINGGAGVLAASVALVTSIAFSIDTTLRIGAACYLLVAAPAVLLASVRSRSNRYLNEFRMGKLQSPILSALLLAATASASAAANSNWSIVEETSADQNSLQFSAGLVVGDAALILRCREERTKAAFSTRDTYLGGENVTVRYRLDQRSP